MSGWSSTHRRIYDHDRHVTGLASLFIDGADGAHIFDQLAPLFDRGLLTPPATRTWPLENGVEAYQTVQDGAHGVKQVLLPAAASASYLCRCMPRPRGRN
jgi:hypothetical protein